MIADILRLDISVVPPGVVAIYVYGSAVTGLMREESDVDIAMLPSYKASDDQRLGLISKVEAVVETFLWENGIRRPVSVLDMRGKYVSVTLLYKVITEGVLLYESDHSERMDFENFVKGEYFDFVPFLKALRKRKYGKLRQEI